MENVNKERKWIIYMYTFLNGKRYIGKTCRSLKDRQESSEWVGYKIVQYCGMRFVNTRYKTFDKTFYLKII